MVEVTLGPRNFFYTQTGSQPRSAAGTPMYPILAIRAQRAHDRVARASRTDVISHVRSQGRHRGTIAKWIGVRSLLAALLLLLLRKLCSRRRRPTVDIVLVVLVVLVVRSFLLELLRRRWLAIEPAKVS